MAARRDLFNELPQETRLQIFRLATIKPSQTEDTRAEYRPFDAVALGDRDWSHSNQIALRVKATIVLVCKEWKALATEMLYECIRIRHGTHNLLSALESTRYSNPDPAGVKVEYDYGRWVRRIEVSSEIRDFDPLNPYPLLRIIQCCPFVQTIVRLYHVISLGPVRLSPGTLFPKFPSIRRIDWWLSGIASQNFRTVAGGICGFFGQLIAHSPALDYLTLSGGSASFLSPRISADPFGGASEPFNSLTTLRLEGGGAESIIVPESMPPLPNLTRLILGGVYASTIKVLERYGHQIRVFEFLVIHSFMPLFDRHRDTDPLTTGDVLKACPNLEELNLRLGSTPLSDNRITVVPIPLNSLRSIRIQLDHSPTPGVGDFIRKYVRCPVLERIVLCGGTRQAWEENPVFPILEKYISENRYLSLEFQES